MAMEFERLRGGRGGEAVCCTEHLGAGLLTEARGTCVHVEAS